MKMDEEGFAYPEIDAKKCINCGLCLKACSRHSKRETSAPLNIYAAKNIDEALRFRSSSGGAFSGLAAYVEKRGGVICGVAYDDRFCAVHRFAETEPEWSTFRTSKYMQSRLEDAFIKVHGYLRDQRMVLFTGTPCQIDGLKQYLSARNASTEKLLTCDNICHGAPSPKVWRDYLDYLQKKGRDKVASVNFRDKQGHGWHGSELTVYGKTGKLLLSGSQKDDCFFQMFFQHYILRPSCHSCPYACFQRPGDITIGDYWGVEKHYPDFDDDKGISLVMCNTEKGQAAWESISNEYIYFPVKPELCTQANLIAPAKSNSQREQFWEGYQKYGFSGIGKKLRLLPLSWWDKVMQLLRRAASKVKRTVFLK